jgi:hypothetical protein
LQLVAHCHTYENTLAICRQNCKGRWLVPFPAMENEKKDRRGGQPFFFSSGFNCAATELCAVKRGA